MPSADLLLHHLGSATLAVVRASGVPADEDEFSGPVSYGDRWLWFAILAFVLVALYYLAVTVWARPRRTPPKPRAPRADVPSARKDHLARLDRIESDVRSGRIKARAGHQELSTTVRSYASRVSSLSALNLALADLRAQGPAPLADAIELMYPPEFAPDAEGEAEPRFDDALRQARRLVASWS